MNSRHRFTATKHPFSFYRNAGRLALLVICFSVSSISVAPGEDPAAGVATKYSYYYKGSHVQMNLSHTMVAIGDSARSLKSIAGARGLT